MMSQSGVFVLRDVLSSLGSFLMDRDLAPGPKGVVRNQATGYWC